MPRFVLQSAFASSIRPAGRLMIFVTALVLFSFSIVDAQTSQWVRPDKASDPLIWGRREGVVFGLPSKGGLKGPRGLIRIGLYTPAGSEAQLLNYIAIEPVVQGPGSRFERMAFSELEMSGLDAGERGKRLTVNGDIAGTLKSFRGREETVQRLSVRIDVETFSANGAHVFVIASIDSDRPEEVRLTTFAEKDSPAIEELTLTATMGNYERLRLLWLKTSTQYSRQLFGKYAEDDFIEGDSYPLSEMLRLQDGDAIVYCTSNEKSPHGTPGNMTAHWPYTLPKLTQYWRIPGYDVQPDLRVRVNARRVYWASHVPVLGGVAFENFEVRQRFVPGQTFVFGISRQEPWMLDRRLAARRLALSNPGRGNTR